MHMHVSNGLDRVLSVLVWVQTVCNGFQHRYTEHELNTRPVCKNPFKQFYINHNLEFSLFSIPANEN